MRRFRHASLLLALAAALAGTAPALAADLSPPLQPIVPAAENPFIDEFRFGVLAHDPTSPEGGSVDLNAEILFEKPFSSPEWWDVFLPRPHLGVTVNTEGETSTLYGGVTWHADIFSTPAFFEASFGGSLNNGQPEKYDNDRSPLGCHELFRESAALGYRLDAHWSLLAAIEHNSNAGLCDYNRGLTNYGAKIGYKF